MEDHLKNKDRLDKEWGALCAYEADPCSTAVSEKVRSLHKLTQVTFVLMHFVLLIAQAENSKKNRYLNSLPFDHSRVILNELVNVTGSDFVNASTIVSQLFIHSYFSNHNTTFSHYIMT